MTILAQLATSSAEASNFSISSKSAEEVDADHIENEEVLQKVVVTIKQDPLNKGNKAPV